VRWTGPRRRPHPTRSGPPRGKFTWKHRRYARKK
jgi:hypothetical protein